MPPPRVPSIPPNPETSRGYRPFHRAGQAGGSFNWSGGVSGPQLPHQFTRCGGDLFWPVKLNVVFGGFGEHQSARSCDAGQRLLRTTPFGAADGKMPTNGVEPGWVVTTTSGRSP